MILFALVGYFCCCCCWIQTVAQQDGSHCCNQVVVGLSHVTNTIQKQVLSLIPDYLSRRAFYPYYFHLDPWNSLINCLKWFYCIYGEEIYILILYRISHFREHWNLYPCISTFTWYACIKFIKVFYFYPNVFGDIWYHFVISSSDFCEKIPTH